MDVGTMIVHMGGVLMDCQCVCLCYFSLHYKIQKMASNNGES